jgi:hypothetical protein
MSDQSGAASDQDAATVAGAAPVTVERAAALLGVSITTVRRRIRAGLLRAEEARRPQGPVWLVYLPPDAAAATASDHEATTVAGAAPTTTPAADAMMSLIQATIGTVLGPLMVEQAALRQTVERQAGEIAGLREDRGRLMAENRALLARTGPQSAEPAGSTFAAHLRPLAPWLLAALAALVALALVAVVVLLVWWW